MNITAEESNQEFLSHKFAQSPRSNLKLRIPSATLSNSITNYQIGGGAPVKHRSIAYNAPKFFARHRTQIFGNLTQQVKRENSTLRPVTSKKTISPRIKKQ